MKHARWNTYFEKQTAASEYGTTTSVQDKRLRCFRTLTLEY